VSELMVYKSVIVACLLLGLFIAERYSPSVIVPESVKSNNRITKNLSLWLCNSLLSPLIVLPITLYAVNLGVNWRSGAFGGWFDSWNGLLIDIVILDLWIYWWHRANHRLPILWRFHRVHHLDQWLDVTSAVRFHFGEVFLSALVRSVVILCLGIPLVSVIIFEGLILINAGFHHSNIRLPVKLERVMSCVVITPSIHWVHHHAIQLDTDSNYGTIFSFWDRVFGSKSKNNRTLDMIIGLDERSDKSFTQLMLEPFQRK